MNDTPLTEDPDEGKPVDDLVMDGPEDPNSVTNDSNVGTVAGTTGPIPLTGGQIVSVTTDDPDEMI